MIEWATSTNIMPPAGTVIVVAAARPNFMKVAPILRELDRRKIHSTLVHTGQHYDANLSDIFFEDLNLRQPEIHLGIGSGSHAFQTGRVMEAFDQVLEKIDSRCVVVVGDVNPTLACSLTAVKRHVPVAHVEAGLRSRDRTMPEEINRIATDVICDLLLTTSADADDNLVQEGIPLSRIHRVGNVMIDSLLHGVERCSGHFRRATGREFPENYAVVTLHRPSNVDHPERLQTLLDQLDASSKVLDLVWPIHPRARTRLQEFGMWDALNNHSRIHMVDPLGYLAFIDLMISSSIAITDSGGLQEETTVLGIPCLTIRDNTERPITIDRGTNVLITSDKITTLPEIVAMKATAPPHIQNLGIEGWDGKAASRVVQVLIDLIGE